MRRLSNPVRIPVLALALLGLSDVPLSSQTPQLFHACYVPLTGTVYRIKEADVRQTCSSTSHVEFSWTDGAGALRDGAAAGGDLSGSLPAPTVAGLQGRPVASATPAAGQVLGFDGSAWVPTTPTAGGGGASDHGALIGLADDDHPQYLLGNGVRSYNDGFAVTGTRGSGTIPISGRGTRLMWYPGKAAFRAGNAAGTEWDDDNIGDYSVAVGNNTIASGNISTALGNFSIASGDRATAIGHRAHASGTFSLATGVVTTASGHYSTAIGSFASTDEREGAFVYGDASDVSIVRSPAANTFTVRAAGGTYFYSNRALTAGVRLAPGAGGWTSVSDVSRKHLFRDEDGEAVLEKISRLPIRSWSYKSQDNGIRHLGPTAQDFFAAFGLGESELGINTVDIDGVNLLAVQALEKRTREQVREIERLRAENERLRRDSDEVRSRLARLEAMLSTAVPDESRQYQR